MMMTGYGCHTIAILLEIREEHVGNFERTLEIQTSSFHRTP